MGTKQLRTRLLCAALLALLCGTAALAGADDDNRPTDWDRARILYQRQQRGESLSPEDQAYLDRAKAERQRQQNLPIPPPRASTGLVPLNQMKGDVRYQGFDGGLYGRGQNQPPESQARAAKDAASQVQPLDRIGHPSKDGKIVLLSIGMSNTTMEFSRFKQLADADPDKSPRLVIVDGAQGGKDAVAWARVDKAGTNPVWDEAERRLSRAGVSPQQVQALWIKQAIPGPARFGTSAKHLDELERDLARILQLSKEHFRNARLAFLSSRIYAGYATTPLNPEPYAYESAFAVRAVIQKQIDGEPDLNADPSRGPLKAPLALWGPYLWSDGVKGRTSDDLIWQRQDFAGDGTHPSPSGRQKVAHLLLRFFRSNPFAKLWFVKEGA